METKVFRLEDLPGILNNVAAQAPLPGIEPDPAVQRAVNEDDKSQVESVFAGWKAMSYILLRGLLNRRDRDELNTMTQQRIFDAFTLGQRAGMAKAEKLQAQLLAMQQQARLDAVLPTCIALAMDATMMEELTIHNEQIGNIWDRVVLHSEVGADCVTYHLVERENSDG